MTAQEEFALQVLDALARLAEAAAKDVEAGGSATNLRQMVTVFDTAAANARAQISVLTADTRPIPVVSHG